MDKEQWDALAVIRMERAKELLTESKELLEKILTNRLTTERSMH